jgi:hypothetical protein
MAGNTKDRIVTGVLCKRKADGSPVVTHVIVREFQWNAGKKARLGDYRYVGIKAWKNSTSKAKFIGFKWVYNSGDKESEYIQQYSDSDLPVFIGDKEKNTLYKKGKLRVIYADKTGVAARGVGVLYLDEEGLLREHSDFSDFVEGHRGEYVLVQGVHGSAKLSSLEEQAVTLLEDNEYKLNRARNRMTGEDCTISELAEDGVYVTGLRRCETGICKVNPRASEIDLEILSGSGVRVLDLSECKELKKCNVSVKGVASFVYVAPLVGFKDTSLEVSNCGSFAIMGDNKEFDSLQVNGSKLQGLKEVVVNDSLELRGCTGIAELSVKSNSTGLRNYNIATCDLERLRITGAEVVSICNCSRLIELSIDIRMLFIDNLSRLVCNCRALEKVVINARRVSYNVDSNREGDPIATATFGSVSLKRVEINVADKLSVGIIPVPNDFAIGYEDGVSVVCNNDKLLAYFKPVKFSTEIKDLLCASVFAPLFYVKERVTVQFNSLLFKGAMVGNPLFRGGEFRIPKEVEALQGSLGSYFPIKSLHLSDKLSVGDSVFKNTGLLEIVGSEYLTSVGALAFAGTKLERLAFGKEAKLGEFAFGGCENLTSVSGLWDIKSAKRTAFALCNSLDSDTLGALYKKQWYMPTDELLSEYPERAYEKYVHREIDSAITKDDCKYTRRLIELRIEEADIKRFMRERGVSKEEKAGLSELSRIIDSIYYTYGVKHSSASATYYVDLGTTERLIYRLRRVLEL